MSASSLPAALQPAAASRHVAAAAAAAIDSMLLSSRSRSSVPKTSGRLLAACGAATTSLRRIAIPGHPGCDWLGAIAHRSMLSFALVVAQLRPTARHRPAALQPPRPPSSSNASAHDGRHDHNASTNSSLRLSADQDGWEPIPTSISDGGGGGPVGAGGSSAATSYSADGAVDDGSSSSPAGRWAAGPPAESGAAAHEEYGAAATPSPRQPQQHDDDAQWLLQLSAGR